ncbi:MAG: pyridoxamine 5'-phosphate oxidase family protein [Parvibaculales bacterium]
MPAGGEKTDVINSPFKAGFARLNVYIYTMREIKPEKNAPDANLLSCHDDLAATLETALSYLERAAADRKSALHTPVLATIGLDGTPRTRMVVLRRMDRESGRLIFHTDLRSGKVEELAKSPMASLLFYDPKKRIQISVTGTAAQLSPDQCVREWQNLHAGSKTVYQIEPAPGDIVATPDQAVYMPRSNQDGRDHFTALTIQIETLEWLYLAAAGHRRARFHFENAMTTPVMNWLAP